MELKDCLQILRDIKDVAFATVDDRGMPQVRIIDVMLANDSNFDRNPLRGCNYGLEGGAFLILGGAVLCQRKRIAFMK